MDTKSPTESLRFADLVDVERLQALTDSFHHVIGVANAVIDVDGTVLTRSGWQDVCVKFHRVHPDTCRLCVESDTALANRLLKGEPYAVYGCLNGLVDTAAPIVVAGRHVANVFTGQFFSSPPDLEAFRQRAARYGFDEEAYMAAVAKVPVLAEERVEALTRLYALLAQWLGDHALDHLRLRQAADELERFNRSLTRRVEEQTREISEQNARLADEIGERRQVEEALRERAEQLRLVLEGGELGFWDWNMETNSVQRNARWAEMLGYTHEEIRQTVKQWMDFVVPEDREVAWKSISDHLAGLTPQHRFEYRMLTKDGGYRWILDCAKVVGRDSDGRALRMCGTHTDITERKRSEERIRQLSRIYAALAKTNHASMHARSEAELFDAVCRIAVEEGGMKLAWIGTRTPGSDRIQPAARYGANPEYLDGIVISTNADEPEGCGPTGTAFREARAVLLQDFQTSSTTTPWRLRASHFGKWHASAAFPVMRNGNPYAVLTLYHAEKNAFDEQNVDLLLSMTSDVGFALDVFDSEARRQAAEQALRVSEERFRTLAAVAPVGIFRCDTQGDCIYVNERWSAIAGLSAAEAMGAGWADALHPDDRDVVFDEWNRSVRENPQFSLEYRFCNRQGQVAWVIGRAVAEIDESTGGIIGYVGTVTDITERKQAEERLRLTARVFESTLEGIIITDAKGNILDVNEAFSRITGYSREEMLGQNPRMLKSGRQGGDFYEAMWRAVRASGHWSGELWNRKKNGEVYPEWITISTIGDSQGEVTHYVGIFSDISLLKQHESQLEHIAHYDALTGVPNRVLLVDRMKQALARSRREAKLLAVCYLDLDGFKPVNDTLGHEAGDLMLIEIARRIDHTLRGGDTVARLGGDEFVVLLLGLDSEEECDITLKRLLHAIAEPVMIHGQHFVVTASIGVTLYPEDDEDPDTLLRHADQAMYIAKQSGKNCCHTYDPTLDAATRTRHQAVTRIEQGLRDNEFVLYYQPKVNLRTQRVVGAEALIRWRHAERGLLPPLEFLPAIEHSELEVILGEWVIDTALAQLAAWHQAGLKIEVSINVSAAHLQSGDFVARLRHELARYPHLPANCLEIEILETAALIDIPKVSQLIEACRAMGVSCALDDFGTGYSSLTYLRNLPAETLKIDQTFIRDMLVDEGDRSIVQGVIALAHTFGRKTVAEGVETVEHFQALLDLGCEIGQGYGIARPMPAEDFLAWCSTRR